MSNLKLKSIYTDPELYKKVKAQAALEGKPLHEWIAAAFVSKLKMSNLKLKSIYIDPELYKKVKAQAALEGKPLHEWIAAAFVSKPNGKYNA